MKGGLDVGQKQGLQIAPFKIAGTVKIAGIPPDVHDAQLVEPGGQGGLGERPRSWRRTFSQMSVTEFKREAPLFQKHLFIIAEKEANGNTYSNNKRRVLNMGAENPRENRFLTSPGDSLIIFLCGMDNFAGCKESNVVRIHQKEAAFIKGGASLWTS